MKVPEYFTDEELSCHCGCGTMPDSEAIERLYALRLLWGMPITIKSGARCVKHNKAIGSGPDSRHVYGKAFDIAVKDHMGQEYDLLKAAIKMGFTGIGIKDNTFLHIDLRFPFAVWGYNK